MSTIVWQPTPVTKADRRRLNGHSSCVVWLTGLSGAGKSTIACALELALHERGVRTYLLDGDNLRHGLNRDLGFSADHRTENIRRAAEVAKLFVDAGVIAICSLISPYRRDREAARALFEPGEFIEVFVDCPVEVCKARDPKGLYRRALAGEIQGFTGIDDPYEPPLAPDVVVKTACMPIHECVKSILHHLEQTGHLGLRDGAAGERAAGER
ncbi:adenylyl-sulfate kinase [Alicyclobacillus acidocaldarius]|uniref:Adenylyl-sulfate kinase n=1 Tax=Alicyclobacillus acidocaldarius (strain Tc-4-1) TaxID=1048834 RepID=F8ID97_ALIAT|nr:adenylyl-sulfate kinase [Alicyclobacillus acidocaldarius]AEJ42563.1 adenylylsulfate kinase [Alicyclobacillus acidocaldarius subsp. acidocaldarius Tc-4-1]